MSPRAPEGELTLRQREILDFIAEHITREQRPPTLREIGIRFNIRSTNGISDHLRALERKGYIEHSPLTSRGIRLVKSKPPGPKAAE